MQVNNINPMNFRAVYRDSSCKFNSKEQAIANDIESKLNQINPKDKKGRTYANYFKDKEGVDILITKEKVKSNAVDVIGIDGLNGQLEKTLVSFDELDYDDEFVIGEYDSCDFKPQDVKRACNSETKEFLWVLACIFSMASLLGLIFSISKGGNNICVKEVPQKVIEVKENLADTLKKVDFGAFKR